MLFSALARIGTRLGSYCWTVMFSKSNPPAAPPCLWKEMILFCRYLPLLAQPQEQLTKRSLSSQDPQRYRAGCELRGGCNSEQSAFLSQSDSHSQLPAPAFPLPETTEIKQMSGATGTLVPTFATVTQQKF